MYKKVEYNHVCEYCGQPFVAHNKSKRFCSRKCCDASYKQKKGPRYKKVEYNHVCECCGQSFVAHRKDKRFCSRKCHDVSYKREKGQDSRLEPRHLTCTICGREFETFNASKKTCSSSCSKEQKRIRPRKPSNNKRKGSTGLAWEEYVQQRREEADQRAKTREVERLWIRAVHTVERQCEYCGATFFCFEWESTKTCSKECSKKRSNSLRDKRIPPHAMIDKDISIKNSSQEIKGYAICAGRNVHLMTGRLPGVDINTRGIHIQR